MGMKMNKLLLNYYTSRLMLPFLYSRNLFYCSGWAYFEHSTVQIRFRAISHFTIQYSNRRASPSRGTNLNSTSTHHHAFHSIPSIHPPSTIHHHPSSIIQFILLNFSLTD